MSRIVGTCCILALLLPGCGWDDSLGKLQRISGHVTYKGKPIKRATIIFAPVASGMLASGDVIDGRYTGLSIGPGRDGVLPGPYLIGLYPSETSPPPPPPPRAALSSNPDSKSVYTPLPEQGVVVPSDLAQRMPRIVTSDGQIVPEKYLDVMKSGLEVKVVPGVYGFDFDLRG